MTTQCPHCGQDIILTKNQSNMGTPRHFGECGRCGLQIVREHSGREFVQREQTRPVVTTAAPERRRSTMSEFRVGDSVRLGGPLGSHGTVRAVRGSVLYVEKQHTSRRWTGWMAAETEHVPAGEECHSECRTGRHHDGTQAHPSA